MTQKKARVAPGVSQSAERISDQSNVRQADGRVNNCRQYLLIHRSNSAACFTTDAHLGDPTHRRFLGEYDLWVRIGQPFETATLLDGQAVAWTDAPFPKRTARDRREIAAHVELLRGWSK